MKGAFFMSQSKQSQSQTPKDGRTRTWALVVYPESAPEDWKQVIADEHVPAFISPLHDKDVSGDGEKKKAHWHVLLMYNGKKSYKQIKDLTDRLNAPPPQPVKDRRGYARYLIHADDPNKHQYEQADVISFGGADYTQFMLGAADTDTAIGEMMAWCIEQGCCSFFRLSNYAKEYRPDWFRVITSSRTVFLTNWLKSMKWEIEQGHDID